MKLPGRTVYSVQRESHCALTLVRESDPQECYAHIPFFFFFFYFFGMCCLIGICFFHFLILIEGYFLQYCDSFCHTSTWIRHRYAFVVSKSLQSCPTLYDPIDGSPPGSPIPGILQARTLEWAAISFSNAWKWKVKGKLLSRVWLFATPWTAAYQAPPSVGFSRQEYWSGVPSPSLIDMHVFPLSWTLFPPSSSPYPSSFFHCTEILESRPSSHQAWKPCRVGWNVPGWQKLWIISRQRQWGGTFTVNHTL